MLSLNTKTKSQPADVLKKALGFFGPDGLGMKVSEQGETYVSFEGTGGYVTVNVFTDSKGASVDLKTQEWEYQVREFAKKILE